MFALSRKIIFIGSLLCISTAAFSQVYSDKESANFSFTIGLTSTSLYNDSVAYRPGILFNGGGIYTLSLSERFNAGVGVLLSGKSFKMDSPLIKYRFYYADVPLFLQAKLTDDVRFSLGGQFSKYLSSSEVRTDTANESGTKSFKYSNIKDIDLSFLAGLEIDLSRNLSMGARYTISSDAFFNRDKVAFGVFQVSFSYVAWRSYKQFFGKKDPS